MDRHVPYPEETFASMPSQMPDPEQACLEREQSEQFCEQIERLRAAIKGLRRRWQLMILFII